MRVRIDNATAMEYIAYYHENGHAEIDDLDKNPPSHTRRKKPQPPADAIAECSKVPQSFESRSYGIRTIVDAGPLIGWLNAADQWPLGALRQPSADDMLAVNRESCRARKLWFEGKTGYQFPTWRNLLDAFLVLESALLVVIGQAPARLDTEKWSAIGPQR